MYEYKFLLSFYSQFSRGGVGGGGGGKDQKTSFTGFLINMCESVSMSVCEKVSEWVVGDEWVWRMWEHLSVKNAQKDS